MIGPSPYEDAPRAEPSRPNLRLWAGGGAVLAVVIVVAVVKLGSSEPPPPPEPVDENPPMSREGALLSKARSEKPEERLRAIKTWRAFKRDQEPGARYHMLKVLKGQLEPPVAEQLLDSLREHPLEVEEAIRCVQEEGILSTPLLRAMVYHLGETGGSRASQVEKALERVPETDDLLVEEALAKLGRGKPGAAARLLQVRGSSWATTPNGERALGGSLDDAGAEALLKAASPRVRILGCTLVGERRLASSLDRVLPLLRDPERKVRLAALGSLQSLQDARASQGLARNLIEESDETIRAKTREALAALPPEPTLAAVEQLYGESDAVDRRAALEGARELELLPAVRLVLRGLGDEDPEVRLSAVRGLDSLRKAPSLRRAVSEGTQTIKRVASRDENREVRRLAKQLYYHLTGRMP